LSLSGNAHEWYKTLDEEVTAKWGSLMNVFFLKIFTPKEAYENRCYIYLIFGLMWERVLPKLGGD
jgi:hypothetical protein